METKDQLVANIKEWIKNDNEIAALQKEIKLRKNKKKILSTALMSTMKTNSIDCFDINGGSIIYKRMTSKKPLNAKSLIAALHNYYKSMSNTNPNLAEEVGKFILDNREEQIKESVVRKMDK
jgi:hypothetical protein